MGDAPAFRIWPPVAIGGPWLLGAALSLTIGDPVSLDHGWARGTGWVLLAAFCVWNGWALILMSMSRTALLPGGSTRLILDSGPFGLSRNPLYIGLLALAASLAMILASFWALVLLPVGFALVWWGAVRPEEQYLTSKFGAEYADYCARVRRWL